MAGNITFDTSDFDRKSSDLIPRVEGLLRQATKDVASEVLRLSTFEVPHDTGMLQASGHVEDLDDESIVGYNKVYAARLHENPQFRFQKGRKGKYLEDPIKNNLNVFLKYFQDAMKGP